MPISLSNGTVCRVYVFLSLNQMREDLKASLGLQPFDTYSQRRNWFAKIWAFISCNCCIELGFLWIFKKKGCYLCPLLHIDQNILCMSWKRNIRNGVCPNINFIFIFYFCLTRFISNLCALPSMSVYVAAHSFCSVLNQFSWHLHTKMAIHT